MGGGATFMGDTVSEDFYKKWRSLQHAVKAHSMEEVAEEAAYTWFNRMVAIRIMVKNGLIAPVLQYESEGVHIPLLVSEARQGRMPVMSADDQRELEELLLDDSKTDEQFRILIVAFCHANPVINSCFGHISDYTELLLPTNILAEGGFVDMLNNTEFISEEDYHSPELIGWLYQFYISEKKDDVFASFKKGKKAEAKDIPAATQIFTPNWIVKYMVQNTIGRIYLDNNPYEEDIKKGWKYLVNQELENLRINTGDRNQELENLRISGQEQFSNSQILDEPNSEQFSNSQILDNILRLDDLKDLKFADLACGSGHILNEAFELLYDLYVNEGYSRKDAIENIFRYNLTGVDIDTRAKQLAQFALMLKACQKDSSFADAHLMPRVLDMPEPYDPEAISMSLESACLKFIGGYENVVAEDLAACFEIMYDADILGSIMDLEIDEDFLAMVKHYYEEWTDGGTDDCPDYIKALLPGVELILALNEKYSALVMNPPYMGSGNMNKVLSDYVKDNYPEGKADLFSVFMEVAINRLADCGKYGMINMHSWMFLSSFEKLRRSLLDNEHIDSLLHLGPRTFDELSGEVVQNAAFVVTNCSSRIRELENFGIYFRLVDGKNCGDKEQMFLDAQTNHTANVYYSNVEQKNFEKIPGCPIGYWLNDNWPKLFDNNDCLESTFEFKKGMSTGDNARFVKNWYEVSLSNIFFDCLSERESLFDNRKWYPINCGGTFRKWYGNQDSVVNWQHNGEEMKANAVILNHGGHWSRYITSVDKFFRKGLSWNAISSGDICVRYFDKGFVFCSASMCGYGDEVKPVIGLLNSKVGMDILKVLAPTMNYGPLQVKKIPLLDESKVSKPIVDNNISISKLDWDSHETSWDFEANPLVAQCNNEKFSNSQILDNNKSYRLVALCNKQTTDYSDLSEEKESEQSEQSVVSNEKFSNSQILDNKKSYRLEDLVKAFEAEWTDRFMQLHENEEELNRQFIEIYGLQDELTPDVPLDEITILQQGEVTIVDS